MNYSELASQESLNKTIEGLKSINVEPIVVENGSEALAKIKELIPAGTSVMNGSSQTLQQIGFIDYLKSDQHQWNNLHAAIVSETDETKKAQLRKAAVNSDYYLGSVHALTESGAFLIASNTGSQLPHVVFTSKNIIFVVSTKKIVPNLDEAFKRLDEYVYPLENKRMEDAGYGGSKVSKIVVFKYENPKFGRNVKMILVKEPLGY